MGGIGSGRKTRKPLSILERVQRERARLEREIQHIDEWLAAVDKLTNQADRILGKSWDGKLWYPLWREAK